ncbi:MAG TPA: hypothetical protein VJQ25_12135 [Nitrospira sp.]|nr:hypothetical protein [Nitrospira sp.]
MPDDVIFTPISEDEYNAAHAPNPTPKRSRAKQLVLEPRNRTTWFSLEQQMDFCTMEQHEEIQSLLNPEQKEYRQKYPTRLVITLEDGRKMCRDCFIHEADKS